jgi:hypothetical protein
MKDEASNAAGGVTAWLERILPVVHSALVLDTGSTDRTLNILQEAAQKHRHLRVRQAPFESFAHARNLALRMALEMQTEDERGRPERIRAAQLEREAHAAAAPNAAAAAGILAAPLPPELPPFRHFLVLDADEALAPSALTLLAQLLALDTGVYDGHCMAPPPEQLLAAAVLAHPPGSASPASARLGFPVALKFSCHCFDSSGKAAPRSNSGLWNPRVFSADARFIFINTVDEYRFERLLFDGRPVDAACYLREAHLSPPILQQYAQLRAQETNLTSVAGTHRVHSSLDLDAGAVAQLTREAQSLAADAGDSPNEEDDDEATSGAVVQDDFELLEEDFLQRDMPTAAFTHLAAQGQPGDDSAAALVSPASRALPLLLPMRHFIPSLAGRRKKNKAYQAGGALARAKAAAAASAAGVSAPSTDASAAASAANGQKPPAKAKSRIFVPSSAAL